MGKEAEAGMETKARMQKDVFKVTFLILLDNSCIDFYANIINM